MRQACVCLFTILLGVLPLRAQFWGLPDWAEAVAKKSGGVPTPEGADAWVLLDQTKLSYRGEGEIRKTRTRVVRILTQKGETEGTFRSRGLGQKVSKIRKLRGWNLCPDGTLTKIDRDDLISIDADILEDRVISANTLERATLPRVQSGSIVAFESQETIRFPLGPIEMVYPLEEHPIQKYSLALETDLAFLSASKEKSISVLLSPRNLPTWSQKVHLSDQLMEIDDLPGWPKDEPWAAPGLETLPYISVVFADPFLSDCPSLSDWNVYGKWISQRYSALAEKIQPVPLEGRGTREALLDLTTWMRESLSYRQVYLRSDRGWIPERSSETLRRRYGDCKDLATLLIGGARSASLEAWPVLARLDRSPIPANPPLNPFIFNHVIVAIRLTTPLGFPAEVVTPDGLFLLVDPTSRTTPLGWLPPAHRGGRLLLCGQEHSVWVDVPDAAILRERVEYLLEGSVSAGGAMKGKLKILEYGDALNLRSTALLEGAKGLREHTLGLSPRALPKSWDVASKSRPTDLSAPFEVSIAFDSEDAFLLKGSEWSLNLPSFPRPPQTLPKPKGARRYPIEVSRGIESHWQANLIFESKRSITGSTAKLLTPLREAAWTATFRDGQLDLTLDHHKKSARWPANELDAALKVIKQDRSDYLLFLENALNFPANSVSTPGHN